MRSGIVFGVTERGIGDDVGPNAATRLSLSCQRYPITSHLVSDIGARPTFGIGSLKNSQRERPCAACATTAKRSPRLVRRRFHWT
jgi:hypothetical protein